MASELWNRTMSEVQAGRLAAALSSLRTHQRMKPRDAEVAQLLGMVLMRTGEVAQAAVQMQRAAELAPANAVHHNNLGTVLLTAKRHADAAAAYARATTLDPGMAGAWMGLANAMLALDRTSEALAASERAIALAPQDSTIVMCHVEALTRAGRDAEARSTLRSHAERHPDDTEVASVLLYGMNYGSDDPAQVVAAHRAFGERLPRPDPPALPHDASRPLRLGIVSCDLRGHSVGFFAEALMREAPAGTELVVFSTASPAWSDDITRRLQSCARAWHQVQAMEDADLDALIRRERIDVLLELTGHFVGNRLPALARKPAPVIVTAIGYPNTTGVPAIDLRLVDSVTDPPGSEALCTERPLRLDPCFLCYTPPRDAPQPAMPPADAPITFGSFNLALKISDHAVALWSRALVAVPGSRLLLKSTGLADAAPRSALLARFAAHGIDPARIEMLGHAPTREAHLRTYARVHVALDTFPYNGTTTTCEALWMGVPVVTIVGDRHAARVGMSLLGAAGLGDWIARDDEDFVRIAIDLAVDRASLESWRGSLRASLLASPLLDARGYALRLHAALRAARADVA
jgi:predicted O-linked N-acetylglucosamine transferase (SPINDLY family)